MKDNKFDVSKVGWVAYGFQFATIISIEITKHFIFTLSNRDVCLIWLFCSDLLATISFIINMEFFVRKPKNVNWIPYAVSFVMLIIMTLLLFDSINLFQNLLD